MSEATTRRLVGFGAFIGLAMTEWGEDYATIALDLDERHRNRNGGLHGGVTLAMMDTAGGLSGCYCAVPGRRRGTVTLSLTTSFVGAPKGPRLIAKGRKRGGGKRLFFSTIELTDSAGNLVALGEGTFQYLPGSEDPAGIPDTGAEKK